jgi:predicted dehydrogenase
MNIAMISSWHVHAKGYAKLLAASPDCRIGAVWDENPDQGRTWAAELGCAYYDDYEKILTDSTIQGVVINAPTVMHPDLIIRAAKAGKHLFTEKVLSITAEDARAIRAAVLEAGIVFSISFPHRFASSMMFAKCMAQEGLLGDLTYARVRNVHNGSLAGWLPESFYVEKDCGGGAMIDLGAHPIYLLEWILGKAQNVTSSFTKVTGKAVEDNAVCVFEFEGGAIGIAETGFVSMYTPITLEISGTKGSLIVREGVLYANDSSDGKWVVPDLLPDPLPPPILQWIDSIRTGCELAVGIDDAVTLTLMMEAAYESYRTARKINIPQR